MPKPVEVLLPRVTHSDLALTLVGEMAQNYAHALRVLARNPGLTNKGVSEAIDRPQGSVGVPCRAARDTLTISDGRGSTSATIEDYSKYAEVCTLLNIPPRTGTRFAKTHSPEGVAPLNTKATSDLLAEVQHLDPLAELRRLVRELRERMKHDGIVSMEITRDEVKVTRSVTTTSALRV